MATYSIEYRQTFDCIDNVEASSEAEARALLLSGHTTNEDQMPGEIDTDSIFIEEAG